MVIFMKEISLMDKDVETESSVGKTEKFLVVFGKIIEWSLDKLMEEKE